VAGVLGTIAIYSASEAFASLVQGVIAEKRTWRVRVFSTPPQLEAYAAIAPVDVLVCDLDAASESAAATLDLPGRISRHGDGSMQVILLTRSLDAGDKSRFLAAGVDEVLIKPMSPLLLAERIAVRLDVARRVAASSSRKASVAPVALPGKVVALADWRRTHSAQRSQT